MEPPLSKTGAAGKPKSESLIDAIPTEVLAPYTAILSVIVANTSGTEWEVGRWILFGLGVALVPAAVFLLWRRQRLADTTRRFPIAGMVAATLAFAAWGLVMPGAPLTYTIAKASSLTIWTFIIITVSGAVIAALPIDRQVQQR